MCIFCKIANKEIPSKIVFENEDIIAFDDISPNAPVHVVIIPKQHIADSANGINAQNSGVIAKIFEAAPEIAKAKNVSQSGYRIITNCGEDAAQSIKHIHFHLLGGKKLSVNLD